MVALMAMNLQLVLSCLAVHNVLLGCWCVSVPPTATRVSVIRNTLSATPTHVAFTYSQGGGVRGRKGDGGEGGLVMATSNDEGSTWSDWSSPVPGGLPLTSNPVTISGLVDGKKVIFIFLQKPNGQISALVQNTSHPSTFDLKYESSDLPAVSSAHQSSDPVQLLSLKNQTFVFVRTLSNASSQVYWNRFDGLLDFLTVKWSLLGDASNHLTFDLYPAVNTYLGRVEVFSVFNSEHVLHVWQDGEASFHKKWEKLGGLFSPKFNSAPVVHQMAYSKHNGVLSLFVRGDDGNLYQISQTFCDKVRNIWEACSWSSFRQIGGTPPSDPIAPNPFAVTHSVRMEIEIFTVGKEKGHLYHIWQKEADASFSDWEDLGPLSDSSPFLSSPALLINKFGFWEAFALDSSHAIKRFDDKPLKFAVSADKVAYDKNVTVTWASPNDQATPFDWIAVYPQGAPGHGYVDFSYVGGSQNPLKDPTSTGTLQFRNTLPNGTYDYRYMVNQQYAAVFNNSVTVYSAPNKTDWVAVFDGISRGLGGFSSNVSACAADPEHAMQTFRVAFETFEDKKIYEGLHLFAEALSYFQDALTRCNETIPKKMKQHLDDFIDNLATCTKGDCDQFEIQVGLEVEITYAYADYEIYRDIQAAMNSFHIKAYEQGGICVGRVTNACINSW